MKEYQAPASQRKKPSKRAMFILWVLALFGGLQIGGSLWAIWHEIEYPRNIFLAVGFGGGVLVIALLLMVVDRNDKSTRNVTALCSCIDSHLNPVRV